MIGFVIGTLCLVGLVKVLRRARFGSPYAFGGGCGPGYGGYGGGGYGRYDGDGPGGDGPDFEGEGGYRQGWRPRGPWHFGYGGHDGSHHWHGWRGQRGGWGQYGQRFFLRGLFQRLDTTPGQEKAIVSAIEDLRAAGKNVKDEMRGARSEVATAMRGESFDEVALGGASARVEHGIDTMRKAGIDAFAKIHEALDERQRGQLADLLERGPRGFGPF